MKKLRLGVAGLGRAFALMLPAFRKDARITLAAAADPRPEARRQFERDFSAPAHATVEELCAAKDLDAIYVATPHQHHAEHAIAAARAGKHVLVEKPLAIALDPARSIRDAARQEGVHVVVGHSHSFDAPIARARELVRSGSLGRVRMVTALYFTDFLYRPRRAEELDTAQGGGVLFSQAAHQVDIVRLLAASRVRSVRAQAGAWDPARATEGAYAALLSFDDGVFASLTYSGYGHFDGDELCGGVSELGLPKDPAQYGMARARLDPATEAQAKNARNYGGERHTPAEGAPSHEHFGFVLVSCEHGDLRPMPEGVWIYGDRERRFEPLARPTVPRVEVIDELCAAVFEGKPPLHDAQWGLDTLAVCVAMRESARNGREVGLDEAGG
jgi:phthalate 4,5-cis-dihydrodiol dehydrogenase